MNYWGPIAGAVGATCWMLGVWVMVRFVFKPHTYKEVTLERVRNDSEPRS